MARTKPLLQLGDRIDLYTGKEPLYVSMLQESTKDGNLLVSEPTEKGAPVMFPKGQGLQLYFYKDNIARYSVNVRVAGYVKRGGLRLLELIVLSKPQKQQRRSSFRLPVGLKVDVRLFEAGPFIDNPSAEEAEYQETVSSINISATGIGLRTKRLYTIGDKLYMRLYLGWPSSSSPPLELLGEVRRTEPADITNNFFNMIGIMFRELTEEQHAHISRYVLLEEQKRIKQKRLIEGN